VRTSVAWTATPKDGGRPARYEPRRVHGAEQSTEPNGLWHGPRTKVNEIMGAVSDSCSAARGWMRRRGVVVAHDGQGDPPMSYGVGGGGPHRRTQLRAPNCRVPVRAAPLGQIHRVAGPFAGVEQGMKEWPPERTFPGCVGSWGPGAARSLVRCRMVRRVDWTALSSSLTVSGSFPMPGSRSSRRLLIEALVGRLVTHARDRPGPARANRLRDARRPVAPTVRKDSGPASGSRWSRAEQSLRARARRSSPAHRRGAPYPTRAGTQIHRRSCSATSPMPHSTSAGPLSRRQTRRKARAGMARNCAQRRAWLRLRKRVRHGMLPTRRVRRNE
jgi:hypothetical protein